MSKNTPKSEYLNHYKSKHGFTLIEVLISMILLVLGCLAALYMQTSAMKGNFQADNLTVATFLAESEVERLKSLSFTDLTNEVNSASQVTAWLNRRGEEVKESDPGLKYKKQIRYFANQPTTSSHQIEVEISWKDIQGPHNILYNVFLTSFDLYSK